MAMDLTRARARRSRALSFLKPSCLSQKCYPTWHEALRIHALEELGIVLGLPQLVDEELDRILSAHRVEDAP